MPVSETKKKKKTNILKKVTSKKAVKENEKSEKSNDDPECKFFFSFLFVFPTKTYLEVKATNEEFPKLIYHHESINPSVCKK